MNETTNNFIPNDQMWLEDDEAWFVDMFENILFTWNITTGICRCVAKIPGEAVAIRYSAEENYLVNPRCIKVGGQVFCLPFHGGSILVYEIESHEFKEIKIDNPNNDFLWISYFWEREGTIWAIANGTNLIVEIDVENKVVKEYYHIFKKSEEKVGIEAEAILVGEYIYGVSKNSNVVYEFSTITKKVKYYRIQGMERGITTICYDEKAFWLSGYNNLICRWNKEKDEVKYIRDVPGDFVNGGSFYSSVSVGRYIFLLPCHAQGTTCNKILYIHKDNYAMHTFDFGDVERQDWWEQKYVIEYVLENRYIGVRYNGNPYVTEIDTQNFCQTCKYMIWDTESFSIYWKNKMKNMSKVSREKNSVDIRYFIKMLLE